MLLKGIYSQLTTGNSAAAVQALLNSPAAESVFINVALKQSAPSYLVLNRVSAPPAGQTLDGASQLIDGEIQFDSYANDQPTAQRLSRTVRDYFMQTFSGGELPDGTTIQFVEVTLDQDMPYEEGGTGYLYRALLRLQALYTEGSFT